MFNRILERVESLSHHHFLHMHRTYPPSTMLTVSDCCRLTVTHLWLNINGVNNEFGSNRFDCDLFQFHHIPTECFFVRTLFIVDDCIEPDWLLMLMDTNCVQPASMFVWDFSLYLYPLSRFSISWDSIWTNTVKHTYIHVYEWKQTNSKSNSRYHTVFSFYNAHYAECTVHSATQYIDNGKSITLICKTTSKNILPLDKLHWVHKSMNLSQAYTNYTFD